MRTFLLVKFRQMANKKAIIVTVAQTAALRTAGISLRYGLTLFIARDLGAAEFGVYSYVMQLAAMFAVLAFMGADNHIMNCLRQLHRDTNIKSVPSPIWLTGALLFGTGAAISLCIAVILPRTSIIGSEFKEELLVGAALVLPTLLLFFQSAVLRAHDHPVKSQVAEQLALPSLTVILYLIFRFRHDADIGAASASDVLIISFAAYSICAVCCVWLVRPFWKRTGPVTIAELWLTARAIAPLGLFAILFQVFLKIPALYIGASLDSAVAGVYFAAARVAEFVEFPLAIVTIIFMRRFALIANDDTKSQKVYLKKISTLCLTMSIAVTAFLYVVSGYLFEYMGAGFERGKLTFLVLASAYLATSFTGFIEFVLITRGQARLVLWSLFLSIFVQLVLFLLLSPQLPESVALIFGFAWILNKMFMYFLWHYSNRKSVD